MEEDSLHNADTENAFWRHGNPRVLMREIEDRAYALYEWRIYHDEPGDPLSDWSTALDQIRVEHGFAPLHPLPDFTPPVEPELYS